VAFRTNTQPFSDKRKPARVLENMLKKLFFVGKTGGVPGITF
jgi:hypothetical protein